MNEEFVTIAKTRDILRALITLTWIGMICPEILLLVVCTRLGIV